MILDEIVSIKKVGVMKTIDIEVDGPDHLFFCNGILTHNSAAGDTNDISEENIQGGISKIQAADNVIGFIPNSNSREMGLLRAKFLKTRDSGGVGKVVEFQVDWSTLTFAPFIKDDGNYTYNNSNGAPPINKTDLNMNKINKGKAKQEPKNDDEKTTDTVESSGTKAKSVIKSIAGRNQPFSKKNLKAAL